MEQLDLGKNNFSGEIPQELSHLTMLAYLDVSSNALCGKIPRGTQFSTFNVTSFQRNKCLCSFPLPTCKEEEKQTLKSTIGRVSQSWSSQVKKHISLIALKFGIGIGFGGVMSVMILWNKARNWIISSET